MVALHGAAPGASSHRLRGGAGAPASVAAVASIALYSSTPSSVGTILSWSGRTQWPGFGAAGLSASPSGSSADCATTTYTPLAGGHPAPLSPPVGPVGPCFGGQPASIATAATRM